MVLIIKKKYNAKKVNQQLKELKPVKVFDASKFAGKIKCKHVNEFTSKQGIDYYKIYHTLVYPFLVN